MNKEILIQTLTTKYHGYIKNYRSRDLIFNEFSGSHFFYIVLKGRVKEVLISKKGGEIILLVYSQNQCFGDFSFMDNKFARDTQAEALSYCKVLQLPLDIVAQLYETNKDFKTYVCENLLGYVQTLTNKFQNISFLSSKERFIQFLLIYTENHNSDSVPLTLNDIAISISCSRQIIYKTLHVLIDKGIVYKQYKKVVIRDRAALVRYLKSR